MENIKPIPRRRYSSTQRRDLVRLHGESGLTLTQFARQHDLKLCTFSQWVKRAKGATRAPRVEFKEMGLPRPFLSHALEIAVGLDITLRLGTHSSPEFIAQVIQQLRRPC